MAESSDSSKNNDSNYTLTFTVNLGTTLAGKPLDAVSQAIDESIKYTTNHLDGTLLTGAALQVKGLHFITTQGVTVAQLAIDFRSGDPDKFMRTLFTSVVSGISGVIGGYIGIEMGGGLGALAGTMVEPGGGTILGEINGAAIGEYIGSAGFATLGQFVGEKIWDNYLLDAINSHASSIDSGDIFGNGTSFTTTLQKNGQPDSFLNYKDSEITNGNLDAILNGYYNGTFLGMAIDNPVLQGLMSDGKDFFLKLSDKAILKYEADTGNKSIIPLSKDMHLKLIFGSNTALFRFLAGGSFWKDLLSPSTWDAIQHSHYDPIIIDLNGDGVKTISKSAGLVFDHDGNLFAENTGWVSPEDGLLVLDKNHDGKIGSGNELFGSNTILNNGQKAQNGYEALREYDENHDGMIDKNDSIWSQLKVWQDKNSNASVDDGELLSMEQLKITGVKLNYQNINNTDSEGNAHLQQGDVIYEDGHIGTAEDIGLDTDKGKTQYVGDSTVSEDVQTLTYIRGFGNVADLQVAMSHNDSLKALVSQYVAASDGDKSCLVEQIIYTWMGVNDTDPHSRGNYIDARHLAVLEITTGNKYHNLMNSANPNPSDGPLLEKEYHKFYGYVDAMLQAQTTYKDIFSKIMVTLDNDSRDFTLNFQEIDKYISGMNNQSEALNLRSLLFSLLSYMPKFDDIRNSLGIFAIRDEAGDGIYQGGNNHSDYYFFEKEHGHDVINGYASNDSQTDTVVFSQAKSSKATFDHVGSDLVIRAYGDDNSVTLKNYFSGENYRRYHLVFDDATLEAEQVMNREYTLTGTAGNDWLRGWGSHDVLIGGAGDDYLAGGNNGSDRYLFEPGHGHDVIEDYAQNDSQADTVVFSQAKSSKATFDHVGSDLVIRAYGDDNSVTLKNYFYGENYQRFNVRFDNRDVSYSELHNSTGSLHTGQSVSLPDLIIEGSLNRLTEAMAAFAPSSAVQSSFYGERLNDNPLPVLSTPGQ
ncbi:hypothetical protein F3U23_21010 [Salmonella enterica]|nr:hypothetical protein [Salmonella enterica]